MNTRTARRPLWLSALGLAMLILFGVGAILALAVSPPDINQGDLIRIMYAHVSVAWVCFLAVGMTALFGALYLWRGRPMDDVWSVASAEAALFFGALTIIGGMTYSKPTLGVFWDWGAKLTLTALLVTLLVGFFIVRGLIDDPQRRGRVSAVIGLVTLASLPFNYLAAEWFRTLHPAKSINLDGSGVTMEAAFLGILLFNVAVAALAFVYFLFERVRLGRLEVQAEASEDDPPPTGETVHV